MRVLLNSLRDKVFILGQVFILFSLFIFFIPSMASDASNNTTGLFFMNFLFGGVYFIAIVTSKWRNLKYWFLLLILLLISAYALNREMNVFDSMAPWFAFLQVLVCINFVLLILFDIIPVWGKHVQCFLLGVGFLVFTYLAIYLIPLYAIGVMASIFLGISLHTFVPLFFCILIIFMMRNIAGTARKYWISFGAGILASLAAVIVFVCFWCHYIWQMDNTFKKASFDNHSEVPAWIAVAEKMPVNMLTNKILKTEFVYAVPRDGWFNWWEMPVRNFEEKRHDPLVMAASFFSGKVQIPENDRIKILECLYDSRHQAQERLWSGEDLVTEKVSGTVQLWPEQRLSYTELDLVIANMDKHWVSSREEAIYTFHLPEGGVVSSLSLWIEGKEEKGILTTKAKADSAYKTIVGVENRDPSVVHWQEGNTVSVRVFPVIPGESRKFKIGITAPMALRDRQLVYENIYFDGPSVSAATQDISIQAAGKKYERKGGYEADWSFLLPAQDIVSASFSFDSSTYTIHPYIKETLPFTATAIYLDINSAWSRNELRKVYDLVKDRHVFVAGKQQVTAENLDRLYDEMSGHTFSLFPFYEIEDNEASLVISKSNTVSPSVDDIRESPFMKTLQSYFMQGRRVNVYDLGEGLSPYLKSLKEFRALRYLHGDRHQLEQLLKARTVTVAKESGDLVVIDNAGITIERTTGTLPATGPDHIMRLFAYNHILQQSGAGLLQGAVIEPALVKEAEKAHVVTPVSSLVVLETQEDYERFNITNSENSLQNASSKSKGAVPEPHEWALIILVCVTLLFFKYRPAWISR